MILNLQMNPYASLPLACTGSTSGSGLCGLSSFPVATEEAPVKVSDSSEGLVADKRGVNSSVSLSLQGTRMTDHQRLEGYKARVLDTTELGSVRSSCHHKYLSYRWEHASSQTHVFLFIISPEGFFLTLSTTHLEIITYHGLFQQPQFGLIAEAAVS